MNKKTSNSKNNALEMPKSTAKKKASTSSKKHIADRVIEFVGAVDDPSLKGRYDALMGVGRPVDDLLASYTELLKESAKVARANIANLVAKEGADLKLQVSRVAVRSFHDLDFSVLEARKEIAKYGKAGYDGVGAVRFCSVPDPETGVAMIAMDAITLYTGSPIPTKPVQRRRRAAYDDGIEHARSVTFNLSDRATVKAAIASLFYPPLTRLPSGDPFDAADHSFAKGSNPTERAFVTLMCRSQLPSKKMLIGFGAGKSVMAGVLERIKFLAGQKCKGTPAVVHLDLVPHFWFDELRRLELHHLSVPTIRLR